MVKVYFGRLFICVCLDVLLSYPSILINHSISSDDDAHFQLADVDKPILKQFVAAAKKNVRVQNYSLVWWLISLQQVEPRLALGGWGGSQFFSYAFAPANRSASVKTILKLASDYGLGGFDFECVLSLVKDYSDISSAAGSTPENRASAVTSFRLRIQAISLRPSKPFAKILSERTSHSQQPSWDLLLMPRVILPVTFPLSRITSTTLRS